MSDSLIGTSESAVKFVDEALAGKPQLYINNADLTATARELRDHLRSSGRLFDRGGPVRVIPSRDDAAPSVKLLTVTDVVIEAHRVCQPTRRVRTELLQTTLPERVARMYLEMSGEHELPPLAGVTTAPLLDADGTIRMHSGYDPVTKLWCSGTPEMGSMVPMTPMADEAQAALAYIRARFKTFPFADAKRRRDPHVGVDVVDQSCAPGADESAFIVALMTAVCRSSLWLAPGVMITAPAISGAGSGKGLLVRAVSIIAFGVRPRAFTAGSERQELEKRLTAELIEAAPVVFLDNANGLVLNSDALASAITERPARVRVLGESRMVELNSTAFIVATGNALSPSGDLARRFILCELDPRCENPETRSFHPGFLDTIQRDRAKLLTAVLTIWRWGRQNADLLSRGIPLGSFEDWAEWCRDSLLVLGCVDPVERIAEGKARDPKRLHVVSIFQTWWEKHQSKPMKASELDEAVTSLIDPQGRGRQYVAPEVGKLAGTRAAGFVLGRQKGGRWDTTTYALERTDG